MSGFIFKFDLTALHFEVVVRKGGLFLGAPLRADSPPVEQQAGEETETGVSDGNNPGKVKGDKTTEV